MQVHLENSAEIANPGWVYVAIAAGVLGVALLVFARIRRFQARPLRICFVLSICAHILLLAVFYVSRVFDMPYIPGSQTSLIVQLSLDDQSESSPPDSDIDPPSTSDEQAVAPTATATPVPLLEPESGEVVDQVVEFPSESSHLDLQAPPLMDVMEVSTTPESAATPVQEPGVVDAESSMPASPIGSDVAELLTIPDVNGFAVGEPQADSTAADDRTDDGKTEAANQTSPASEQLALRSPSAGAWRAVTSSHRIPHRYHDRFHRPNGEELAQRGGSPATERAVDLALQWLARNQASDGRWDAVQHGAGRGGWIEGQHRGSTGLQADTGITGLALLSFLGAGNTHQSGTYHEHVNNAIRYLLQQQSASGSLGGQATIYAHMYCHGIATLAICEALAMSGDEELRGAAQNAINYTIRSQHRRTGGWRYRPGEPGDTSQFGWQLMAVVSAKEANLAVPDEVELWMRQFLNSVQSGASGGLAAYRPQQGVSRCMTAEALACRNFLGINEARGDQEAIRYIMSMKPGMGPRNFYYWYYATVALSQLNCEQWHDWNVALQSDLLKTQRSTGDVAGSWEPNTVWGPVGGRVYSTAMATLCLESYYRYAR